MITWLCVFCFLLAAALLLVILKILLMRRALREICRELQEKLEEDTNTLLRVSSRDSSIRSLAAQLNTQLRLLRDRRHKYQQGDRELKEAITNMAHDLRTPLTAICGYLELLKQDCPPSRYFDLLENRTELLKTLTEELFRYSVLLAEEDWEPETVLLNSVLQECLASHYSDFKKEGIIPEIHLTENPVSRSLNRSFLCRILDNIISNAIKYSDGDFQVFLDESGEMRFSNLVRDLTPVAAGRLFDRFYTVKTGAREASGLGLSIAKTLTERMGGTIRAEYRQERLSIFLSFSARM